MLTFHMPIILILPVLQNFGDKNRSISILYLKPGMVLYFRLAD